MKIQKVTEKIFFCLRGLVYAWLFAMDRLLGRKMPVVIFCYHSVGTTPWRYSVPLAMFKKQIRYLKENYQVISIKDLQHYLAGQMSADKPLALITFDDGLQDIMKIRSFFKKLAIQPVLFLLADPLNANRKELGTDMALLTKANARKLMVDGWTIGCHSATHPDFSLLAKDKLKREVLDAKVRLESDFGVTVSCFAYPKGRYSGEVINAVSQTAYSLAFSMEEGEVNPAVNRFLLPRVGIDSSHSLLEFKAAVSPSVVEFRGYIKKLLKLHRDLMSALVTTSTAWRRFTVAFGGKDQSQSRTKIDIPYINLL